MLQKVDITTLKCDAVVNAANSGMTGCYIPNHRCIDNAIHTFAGMQLRLICDNLMEQQGYPEPAGGAKITPAFNLQSRYVLHTVGPVISGKVKSTRENCLHHATALAWGWRRRINQKVLHSAVFLQVNSIFPMSWRQRLPCRVLRSFSGYRRA